MAGNFVLEILKYRVWKAEPMSEVHDDKLQRILNRIRALMESL